MKSLLILSYSTSPKLSTSPGLYFTYSKLCSSFHIMSHFLDRSQSYYILIFEWFSFKYCHIQSFYGWTLRISLNLNFSLQFYAKVTDCPCGMNLIFTLLNKEINFPAIPSKIALLCIQYVFQPPTLFFLLFRNSDSLLL